MNAITAVTLNPDGNKDDDWAKTNSVIVLDVKQSHVCFGLTSADGMWHSGG